MSTLAEQVRELEAERDYWRESYDKQFVMFCKELDAKTAAESRLAQAQREAFMAGVRWEFCERTSVDVASVEAARRYPAVPEGGERRSRKCPACEHHVAAHTEDCPNRPTPTPERVTSLSGGISGNSEIVDDSEPELWLEVQNNVVFIKASMARRIVSLAAQDGGSDV